MVGPKGPRQHSWQESLPKLYSMPHEAPRDNPLREALARGQAAARWMGKAGDSTYDAQKRMAMTAFKRAGRFGKMPVVRKRAQKRTAGET